MLTILADRMETPVKHVELLWCEAESVGVVAATLGDPPAVAKVSAIKLVHTAQDWAKLIGLSLRHLNGVSEIGRVRVPLRRPSGLLSTETGDCSRLHVRSSSLGCCRVSRVLRCDAGARLGTLRCNQPDVRRLPLIKTSFAFRCGRQ